MCLSNPVDSLVICTLQQTPYGAHRWKHSHNCCRSLWVYVSCSVRAVTRFCQNVYNPLQRTAAAIRNRDGAAPHRKSERSARPDGIKKRWYSAVLHRGLECACLVSAAQTDVFRFLSRLYFPYFTYTMSTRLGSPDHSTKVQIYFSNHFHFDKLLT